ncbi:hypothetical protein DY000_02039863 [Brassica cretica]|uniref:DUF4005 domain-containing protein n=1 Tax=Brassica cretica TaxID=69181 RepID=A0ABQ7B8J0_BRACR|nr:hypothetical protein DY000_02039863 [Brassica cretica]
MEIRASRMPKRASRMPKRANKTTSASIGIRKTTQRRILSGLVQLSKSPNGRVRRLVRRVRQLVRRVGSTETPIETKRKALQSEFKRERKGGALEGWSTRQFGELNRSNSPNGRVGGLARSNSQKARVGRLGWSNLSFDEISSELTIRGRYEEEATVRRTSSAVDRYRREASTIEDYDRSMYILYHRSMSRREMRNLVPADFKPKASPTYKITPDEFLT